MIIPTSSSSYLVIILLALSLLPVSSTLKLLTDNSALAFPPNSNSTSASVITKATTSSGTLTPKTPAISVKTDKREYVRNEPVNVSGKVSKVIGDQKMSYARTDLPSCLINIVLAD